MGEFGIIHPEVLAAFDIVNPGGLVAQPLGFCAAAHGLLAVAVVIQLAVAACSRHRRAPSRAAPTVAALELDVEPFCFDKDLRPLPTQIL